jgi:hypothetical protein
MMRNRFVLPLGLVALWLTAGAAAQQPPQPPQPAQPAQLPQDALSALRAKTDLTDDERNQIRGFVADRVGELVGPDAALAREAGSVLRAGYAGSAPFKQAYAAACVGVFGSAFPKADVAPAARLLTILSTLNVVEARSVFFEALQDERVGIRAAAALGLRALRPKLAQAGGEVFMSTLATLRDAAKKERARDTLRAIYAALNFAEIPSPPDLKPVAAALLDVLEERAKPYAARQDVPAVGADDAGLAVAEKMVRALSDDERRRLTVATATLVRRAIEEYTASDKKTVLAQVRDTDSSELVEYRNAMERLVLFGERLLVALQSPAKPPSVLEPMKKGDKAGMKLQWKAWGDLLKPTVGQDFPLVETPEPGGGG